MRPYKKRKTMSNQKLTQTQRLELKLSPQQIQLMKLLQLPTIELEQRIKEEIEANPALEDASENEEFEDNETIADEDNDNGENESGESDDYNEDEPAFDKDEEFDITDYLQDEDIDDYSYKLQTNNRSSDDEDYETPISSETSFQEYLLQQLGYRELTEKQELLGSYIIGNLDDNGYMSRKVSEIVDDLIFTQNIEATEEEVAEVLAIVQELDPPGIAARDLQECMLIQLERLQEDNPFNDYSLAITVVKECFEEFTKKHYDKIVKKLEVSNQQLKAAIDEILKLNPKPGDTSSTGTKNSHYITPDFFVYVKDNIIELSLESRNMPELRVSREYISMLEEYSSYKDMPRMQEAVQFVKQKIDSAKLFIGAIQQRQKTLYITMKAIIDKQQEFFLTGDETKLKPMILKDIADTVGLDISTISRVANSKYVQTPYGVFLLKFFFSEGITNTEGEEVSTREIKRILQDCVDEEDKKKPMTDEALMEILKDKGYPIARRTVAKYREQLGIPVARLRKEI